MWSVTNYFLVNLTVADLLMAALNCIPSFLFMRDRVWLFGPVYCSINNFISYLTVSCSVLTLLAITCHRRQAIVRPLAPRPGRHTSLLTILAIWLLSGSIASPALLFSREVVAGCSKLCIMVWPDGYQGSSTYDYIYNIALFLATYLLPGLGLVLSYAQMGIQLWRGDREAIGAGPLHPAILRSRRQKKRIVKMFGLVVGIFMVCWAPYHVYFLLAFHFPALTRQPWTAHLYLLFYWLAMSNTCVNPIIYYWMNSRFREYFDRVLCCGRLQLQLHRVPAVRPVRSLTTGRTGRELGLPRSLSCPAPGPGALSTTQPWALTTTSLHPSPALHLPSHNGWSEALSTTQLTKPALAGCGVLPRLQGRCRHGPGFHHACEELI